MMIGIPKETKADEYRVSMLPVGVEMLVRAGHEVLVEQKAGAGSGYEDGQYEAAGATLIETAAEVFERAELIVKVKEPQPAETAMLRAGQTVFTYFHFAADRELTRQCLAARITALAYETLSEPATGGGGGSSSTTRPLLTPMSEVAGRMSVQEGAKSLERPNQGRGVLLGGVTGVKPGNVLVLGAGVVGANAAKMAAGLGANVVIMDIDLDRLRYLDDIMPPNVDTVYSDSHAIAAHAVEADLIVGAVLIPGGRTPQLIPRDLLKEMKTGAVIVDVGVDQGGCVETSRPTTHHEPTFLIEDVVHYCVANMPGAVGRTSTQALCHATQPYILRLAARGVDELVDSDTAFATALNLRDGDLTNQAVAAAHDL